MSDQIAEPCPDCGKWMWFSVKDDWFPQHDCGGPKPAPGEPGSRENPVEYDEDKANWD